jgi:hypothetical protein
MSVELVTTVNRTIPNFYATHAVRLDDDGYYWFLYPLFEQVYAQTGKRIELHGRAEFNAAQLSILQAAIQQGREFVQQLPETWSVPSHLRRGSTSEPLRMTVSKQQFLSLFEQFDHLITQAIAQQEHIVCIGD